MNKKNDLFNTTFDKLIMKAVEDGIVTPDETKIIRQVEINAKKYSELLEEATEDGVISKNEADQLNQYKHKIIKEAENIAKMDGKFTDDEKELIKSLSNIISKYYKNF